MYALGLYDDGPLLKIALLRREKNQIQIELVHTIDLQKEGDIFSELFPILTEKKALVVTGLESWEILLREIEVNLKRKREIFSVLPFQSESQIPYPLEEAILVPFLFKKETEFTKVILFSTKKLCVEDHLQKMASRQIEPDWISCVPSALCRYAKSYITKNTLSLFYLGMEKSAVVSIVEGSLVFSQSLSFGLSPFLQALQEDAPEMTIEEVDFSSLDPEEFPHVIEILYKFKKEWERLQTFIKKRQLPHEFLFLGSIPPSLRHFLEEEKTDRGDHPSYAIPIGLCLDAIFQDEHSIQFRQASFVSSKLIKTRIKKLIYSVFSLLFIFLVVLATTHFFLKYKENVIIEKAEKYQGITIEKNHDALLQSLRTWGKSLGDQKIPFPYQLTTPSVSDFLAWISTHPHLSQSGIEIKRIHYGLTKYPILGKSNVTYQAKVELEFFASSPTIAREFHESLLKGEGLVNPKHPVSWNAQENKYFTSFILKEKS